MTDRRSTESLTIRRGMQAADGRRGVGKNLVGSRYSEVPRMSGKVHARDEYSRVSLDVIR